MKAKDILTFCVFTAVLLAPSACRAYPGWRTAQSPHFVVSCRQSPVKSPRLVLESAERHFKRLTATMGWGDARTWTGERKGRIILYGDKQEFLAATGVAEWSDATSIQRERTIISYYGALKFTEKALPHELAHILIREYFGFDNAAVPLWLEEGLASLQEEFDAAELNDRLQKLLVEGRLPSASELTKMDAGVMGKKDAEVFFTAAAGLTEFLVRRPGFTVFCRSLRDDRDLATALKKGYGIDGLADLDRRWKVKETGVMYWHGDVKQKKIALTFDDGPNAVYTPQILDILKKYNVKATFFLIGKNVERSPQVARRIADEGHCIGNHSYIHPDFMFESNPLIAEQLTKTEETIKQAAGVTTFLFRPPYGIEDRRVLVDAEKLGYVIVEWSVTGGNGWEEIKSADIVRNVVSETRNGSIILLHDGNRLVKDPPRAQVVGSLPAIIEALQKKGYRFVTIPELLDLDEKTDAEKK